MEIIYIYNPSRYYKVVPLLENFSVAFLKNWQDILSINISDFKGNAVIIDSFGRLGILGLITSFCFNLPLIIRLRGDFFRESRERNWRKKPYIFYCFNYWISVCIAKLCLWRSGLIIFNSHYLKKTMFSSINKKVSAVVYNPYTAKNINDFSTEHLVLPQGKLHLLTVTNMNLYSKLQPTIDAVKEWLPADLWEKLDIQWIILGNGYHKNRFQNEINNLQLGDRVHLLGWVDNTSELYNWSNIVIHFTKMDAFPNATLEGMMHDKPIITNQNSCGTLEQVIDGFNGFVVNDSDGLIRALAKYSDDKHLRMKHGEIGKKFVENNFTIPLQKKKMEKVINVFLKLNEKTT